MLKQLFILVAASCSLFAEIIEVKHFSELPHYVNSETLVILDIDNTLLMPTQELGSDQWFRYRLDSYRKEGKTYPQALELALPEWEAVQNITDVAVVEMETPTIIEKLQEKNIPVIGLSTRGLALAMRTVQQLDSVGINLQVTAPSKEEIPLLNPHAILFRKGILFTAGTHKGKGLQKLLAKLDYKPKRILFINDKRGNLRQLEEGVNELKIPFTGLRYGYLDDKVRNFRSDIADLQLENFKMIVSDKDAETILNSRG
ncbi:MAG: hypothetical protein S4CHLAM81_01190 [Chlamydiales bacterium]|nr:hypothetical protein [Chlamydiales bacterium]MCH9634915.1 hypothetical protein [Chlamydiales bacterium]MCH9704436.1 DUF2608 domain-containing protein [Chlamydiota bacterium]